MCTHSCGKGSCTLSMVAKVLVIIGGVNWGLVGLGMLLGSMSNWNVVNMLLDGVPVIEALVYLLVGVAALVMCFGCKCKTCKGGNCKDGVCTPSDHNKMATGETMGASSEASSI